MTFEEHARAITAAIQAAADDGFYLDDANGEPIQAADLNRYKDGGGYIDVVDRRRVELPVNPFHKE